MLSAMRWLAKARRWRGTALDPFGYTHERRAERALVDDYERRVDALLSSLNASRIPLATRIAEVPEQIRGFGHIKEAAMLKAHEEWRSLGSQWDEPEAPQALAA